MVLGHDINNGQRTQDVRISEDVSFDTMLLTNNTLKGLRNAGFLKPSPVQLHGIPLGKCGFDLLLEAKSGTGKTAVFTVISLEKLDLHKGIQTIILAPTREIASQICDVVNIIGSSYKGLKVAVVMGGLPVKEDIERLKQNVHIVVGSPGRLRHLIQGKYIDVSSVRLFVLDEADKLMEKSFLPDINYIFSLLPKQKQVIMSSATYAEEIKTFVGKYVQKAQHVCPDSNNVLLGIEQKITIVSYNCNIVKQTKYRYEELKKILSGKQFKQCLIFCNYQVRVGELHRMLTRDKWPSEQLYGRQDQTDRLDALKTLQEYKCRILISTDLAARGIDASNVDLVINFEPPFEWQTYLHRIGRAGRYGSYGIVISILSEGKEKIQFKRTLGLSNIRFHLQDFWSEEPFNLDNAESSFVENKSLLNSSSESKSIKHDNKVDLWEALTKESSEQNDTNLQMSSFEGLCDSFKKSRETNQLSFSELMESFMEIQSELNENETDCSKYVHVSTFPVSKINSDGTFQKKRCDLPAVDKIEYITETDYKGNKPNEETADSYNIGCLASGIHVLQDRYEKDTNNSSNFKDNMLHHKSITIKKSQNGVESEVLQKIFEQNSDFRVVSDDDPTAALVEAGLPTAFGKSRLKKNSHRASNVYCNNNCNKNELSEAPSQNSILHSKYDQKIKDAHIVQLDTKKSNLCYNNDSLPNSTIESYQCGKSSSADQINESQSTSQPRNNYSKYTHLRHYQKYNGFNHDQIMQRSKHFDLWYNRLRSQTQYIQYALYLEELIKL